LHAFRLRDLFHDPLYRWEVRRYWTRGRRLLSLLLLGGWWSLTYYVTERAGWYDGNFEVREVVLILAGVSLLSRGALSFLAATGAALSVVPEKASGQLEQFVLTPVDPWRFCLARYLGRLRGLLLPWVLTAGALAWGVLFAWLDDTGAETPARLVIPLLVILAAQVDLAMMLTVDAALGMRFSCASRSTVEALARTYWTAFLVVPFFMTMGVLAIFLLLVTVAAFLFDISYSAHVEITMCLAVLVIRLALGTLVVWGVLHDVRRAVEKTFFRPGEA